MCGCNYFWRQNHKKPKYPIPEGTNIEEVSKYLNASPELTTYLLETTSPEKRTDKLAQFQELKAKEPIFTEEELATKLKAKHDLQDKLVANR